MSRTSRKSAGWCGTTSRLLSSSTATDLTAARASGSPPNCAPRGYTDVRRYQLGIPTWRAAGEVCEVELDGIRHIVANDGTAVVIDAREAPAFVQGTLRGARNIPRSLVLEAKDTGEVRRAKDDGRLPMEDHNTRVVVIGADGMAARYVAEALAREAFHNVTYFPGPFATVSTALNGR